MELIPCSSREAGAWFCDDEMTSNRRIRQGDTRVAGIHLSFRHQARADTDHSTTCKRARSHQDATAPLQGRCSCSTLASSYGTFLFMDAVGCLSRNGRTRVEGSCAPPSTFLANTNEATGGSSQKWSSQAMSRCGGSCRARAAVKAMARKRSAVEPPRLRFAERIKLFARSLGEEASGGGPSSRPQAGTE